MDVNDNPPSFSNDSNYVFYAVESYNANTRVGTVIATDKDTGTNGEIIYSISAETESRGKSYCKQHLNIRKLSKEIVIS